jgi:predicted nucleic acid-binding protein
MAGDYVVDACVAAKILFAEKGSDAALTLMRDADRLIAPELILLEVANVAVKKMRRREISLAQAREAVADLPDLFDRIIPLEGLLSDALELALTTHAAIYDALYAALAQREGFVLVTADKKFAAAIEANPHPHTILVLE